MRKFMVKFASERHPLGPFYAFTLGGARRKILRFYRLSTKVKGFHIWEV